MKKILCQLLALFAVLSLPFACVDVLEPENDNTLDAEDLGTAATYMEGFLINAYRNLPTSHQTFNLSYACDDAVNNNPSSSIKTTIAGGWTSDANPFSVWNTTYESILYIHTFLDKMDGVDWFFASEEATAAFDQKLRGEAYALRAWNYFQLLQAHAGKGANGEMLGVPLVKKVLSPTDAEGYELQRSSFSELVEFILEDCDSANSLLPNRWVNTGDATIDVAIGARSNNRINGIVARFIKAKTLLYAASPAYSDGTYTYKMAATAAAEIMNINKGLSKVAGGSVEFYSNSDESKDNKSNELFWYSSKQNRANSWEVTNYPPSLYGEGLTNPTQNLVDAFPMLDGTPTPSSKINSADPYSNRDPRLGKYIFYNGSMLSSKMINTTAGSQDAVGSQDIKATKTGYYLKKFMNVSKVDLDPSVMSEGMRYYTYARYTDVLLMFAEAANEAGGPNAAIGGYTAREVVNAIRTRAGITSTAYVDGLSKSQMTDLIRNERRIEMCFEKQRFWDLRRWKMTTEMNNAVSGVQVSADGSSYSYMQVENRDYKDYQIYGPIPYSETLKYSIVQNEGWK